MKTLPARLTTAALVVAVLIGTCHLLSATQDPRLDAEKIAAAAGTKATTAPDGSILAMRLLYSLT